MGQYIGVVICSLIGVGMLLFAVKRIIETVIFIRASHKAPGKVVSLATSRNSDGQTTYLPVVAFKTAGDKTVRFTSTVASNPPAYKVGDKVGVRFLSKNPQSAKLDSFSEIWLLTLVLALVGPLCLFIAFIIFQSGPQGHRFTN